jgi:hypothetical protein
MQVDREVSKATNLKANPEEMESESKHQEVPKEPAAVKPVGGLRKWHRSQPKELTQGNFRSQRKFAAACR